VQAVPAGRRLVAEKVCSEFGLSSTISASPYNKLQSGYFATNLLSGKNVMIDFLTNEQKD
jgi:hypothetical protein